MSGLQHWTVRIVVLLGVQGSCHGSGGAAGFAPHITGRSGPVHRQTVDLRRKGSLLIGEPRTGPIDKVVLTSDGPSADSLILRQRPLDDGLRLISMALGPALSNRLRRVSLFLETPPNSWVAFWNGRRWERISEVVEVDRRCGSRVDRKRITAVTTHGPCHVLLGPAGESMLDPCLDPSSWLGPEGSIWSGMWNVLLPGLALVALRCSPRGSSRRRG
jgi:hypothetical protein